MRGAVDISRRGLGDRYAVDPFVEGEFGFAVAGDGPRDAIDSVLPQVGERRELGRQAVAGFPFPARVRLGGEAGMAALDAKHPAVAAAARHLRHANRFTGEPACPSADLLYREG